MLAVFKASAPASFALALGFTKILLAEDRRNHPIGRSIADAGRDEKGSGNIARKPVKSLVPTKYRTTDGGRRHPR